MFKLACPSCGAEVSFRSPTSAMAVCAYCRSTVLRDADAVRTGGKMSAALEDYSPIQLGTAGIYAGRPFTVIGRIQLRYDDGFWNEWFIFFDDGEAGWLADASGQYALTLDSGPAPDAPPFGDIVPGGQYRWRGDTYTASDVRSARCTGGEGELPFRVGPGWEAKVADYRQAHRFLTLDYTDGTPPRCYAGKAVTLPDLRCQRLREPAEIAARAGKLPGSAQSVACPACGSTIEWRPAVATHLHCPACGAVSEVSGASAELLQAASREAAQTFTLALGDVATLDGVRYTLIGLMRRRSGPDERWTEYLLFAETAGFLWLVETREAWYQVRVLDTWPEAASASAVKLDEASYTRMEAYSAEVTYAAGAFNWRVRVGERCAVTDYSGSRGTLTSEGTAHELTWSFSQRVAAATVDGWFGKGGALAGYRASQAAPLTARESSEATWAELRGPAIFASVVLTILNLPVVFFGRGEGSFSIFVVALILLWLPLPGILGLLLRRLDDRE